MRTIKIDDEIWDLLKSKAIPFEDEPNDALRRLLKLPERNAQRNVATVVEGLGSGAMQSGRARFDRTKIEEAIIEIVRERGGQTPVKDPISGFNIYEEVADRIGVPRDARKELTPAGENRWRAEVGFGRKNLEQRGIIAPTGESGRGVWKLR